MFELIRRQVTSQQTRETDLRVKTRVSQSFAFITRFELLSTFVDLGLALYSVCFVLGIAIRGHLASSAYSLIKVSTFICHLHPPASISTQNAVVIPNCATSDSRGKFYDELCT